MKFRAQYRSIAGATALILGICLFAPVGFSAPDFCLRYSIFGHPSGKWIESARIRLVFERPNEWKVFDKEGVFLGVVSLDRKGADSFEVGIKLKTHGQSRGLGPEIEFALFTHAFQHMRADKIIARIYESNDASLKMHEKLGFRFEEKQNGDEGPFGIFSLSREDFQKLNERIGDTEPHVYFQNLPKNPGKEAPSYAWKNPADAEHALLQAQQKMIDVIYRDQDLIDQVYTLPAISKDLRDRVAEKNEAVKAKLTAELGAALATASPHEAAALRAAFDQKIREVDVPLALAMLAKEMAALRRGYANAGHVISTLEGFERNGIDGNIAIEAIRENVRPLLARLRADAIPTKQTVYVPLAKPAAKVVVDPATKRISTNRIRLAPKAGSENHWNILDEKNMYLGNVTLTPKPGNLFEIGIVVNRQQNSIGPEAEFALLEYVFTHLKPAKIIAKISDKNPASLRMHEKLGYRFEKKSSDMFETNVGIYSISAEDFAELKRRMGDTEPHVYFQNFPKKPGTHWEWKDQYGIDHFFDEQQITLMKNLREKRDLLDYVYAPTAMSTPALDIILKKLTADKEVLRLNLQKELATASPQEAGSLQGKFYRAIGELDNAVASALLAREMRIARENLHDAETVITTLEQIERRGFRGDRAFDAIKEKVRPILNALRGQAQRRSAP